MLLQEICNMNHFTEQATTTYTRLRASIFFVNLLLGPIRQLRRSRKADDRVFTAFCLSEGVFNNFQFNRLFG